VERIKKISPTLSKKEFERLTIELSWKSSQIEGNTYSLIDTEILIKQHKLAKNHTKEEAQMILNHKEALDYIIANKDIFKKMTLAKIENIHKLLVSKMGISPNIRKSLVGVTGTKYMPLDNSYQIKEAMDKLILILNKKQEHPLLKALASVLLISYIQPFEDGNKRTSRMISNAILLAHYSIPLSYRIIDIEEYKKAVILFYELNNISYI
jgi:Fic family protein